MHKKMTLAKETQQDILYDDLKIENKKLKSQIDELKN